jgi:hypothetical protein
MTQAKKKASKKRGPQADRVKVSGDWQTAVKKALEKPRPAQGWPEQPRWPRAK